MLCKIAGTGAVLGLMAGLMGAAQAEGFDPRADCATLLGNATPAEQVMIAAWTFGYLAATADNIRPVETRNNAVLLGNIAKVCQANAGASLLDIVAANSKPAAASPAASAAPAPGSEAEARALLMQYYAPGADYLALTQALLPTEAEVRTVYADPLGSALWRDLSSQIGPGTAFGPKPDHNDLIVVYATTRALAEKRPVLNEFPGGYKDVLQYFKVDVPIVRFKFVTRGDTLGLAFDGLIYLNGRWVIMPKPWRSLPG
ncbi:hypothetical protein PVW51_18240 [Sulfitobacter sp. PR48]|uniref:hypothetical protein n=1 Tax=Sulfitobacter sp. PR48 TaxID=3028383 RepID=UPI00237ADC75|nr:hypothetical protein [Sulfitobacter sp. PR48]MDD9722649.1 hypothetical protein [Sulfitobacter sp. PR48]